MAQPGKLPGNLMATAYLQAAGLVCSRRSDALHRQSCGGTSSRKASRKAGRKTGRKAGTACQDARRRGRQNQPRWSSHKTGRPVKPAEPVVVAKPIEPVRRTPAREDDDRMGQPVLQLRPPSRVAAESPKPALSEPPAKPTPPVKVAPPVETVAPPVAAPRSNLLEALESLPPPVDEPEAASTPAKIELPPSVTGRPARC